MSSELISEVLHVNGVLGRGLSVLEMIRLKNSFENGFIKILKDSEYGVIGYILYAKVDAYTVRSILNLEFPRYSYEWNDGKFVFIHDLVISRRCGNVSFRPIVEFIKDQKALVYQRGRLIKVLKRKGGRFSTLKKRIVSGL